MTILLLLQAQHRLMVSVLSHVSTYNNTVITFPLNSKHMQSVQGHVFTQNTKLPPVIYSNLRTGCIFDKEDLPTSNHPLFPSAHLHLHISIQVDNELSSRGVVPRVVVVSGSVSGHTTGAAQLFREVADISC